MLVKYFSMVQETSARREHQTFRIPLDLPLKPDQRSLRSFTINERYIDVENALKRVYFIFCIFGLTMLNPRHSFTNCKLRQRASSKNGNRDPGYVMDL